MKILVKDVRLRNWLMTLDLTKLNNRQSKSLDLLIQGATESQIHFHYGQHRMYYTAKQTFQLKNISNKQ